MISQVQTNMGIFSSAMPGARMFMMVAMILIEPMIDEMPIMCRARMPKSTPMPPWMDSGG